MRLEGGVHVRHGEKRHDQPFRVCVHTDDQEEDGSEFWTNDEEEAATMFHLMVRRVMKTLKRK